jgi:riboflavin synthase
MFTGIIEELGAVVEVTAGPKSARIAVQGPLVTSDAVPGASISVNGVCLTVVHVAGDTFHVDVMQQTLDLATLGEVGEPVNLERAVPAGGRLGGHIVQGHVDGTGTVIERVPGDGWELVRIAVPPRLSRYVVAQGSIAAAGASLPVAAPDPPPDGGCVVTVSLIPETLARTTLGHRAAGDRVNLEVDILAKYVERITAKPAVVTS